MPLPVFISISVNGSLPILILFCHLQRYGSYHLKLSVVFTVKVQIILKKYIQKATESVKSAEKDSVSDI